MNGVIIETGHSGPSAPVADRIAGAFNTLEVAEWLVPDDAAERHRLMAGQFEMLIGPALDGFGHVDVGVDLDGGLVGAAVWLDFTRAEFPSPPFYEERLAELCGEHLPRFQALDEVFGHHHPDPSVEPHLHLAFCAVDPAHQGKGLGATLLRQGLARLDESGAAAYLEAADKPLIDWYGRHGFESRGELALPEGPSMYPMWRAPRGAKSD